MSNLNEAQFGDAPAKPAVKWRTWPSRKQIGWHIMGEHMTGRARSLNRHEKDWVAEHQKMHAEGQDMGIPHNHFVPKKRRY